MLTIRYGLFFWASALANEIIRRTQTAEVWATFRVVAIVAAVLFGAAQFPLLRKYWHDAGPSRGARSRPSRVSEARGIDVHGRSVVKLTQLSGTEAMTVCRDRGRHGQETEESPTAGFRSRSTHLLHRVLQLALDFHAEAVGPGRPHAAPIHGAGRRRRG